MILNLISGIRSGKLSWQLALPLSIFFAFFYPFLAPPNFESSIDVIKTTAPHVTTPLSATLPEDILRSEVLHRVHDLAKISQACENGAAGVNRPFLSQTGHLARQKILTYMTDAGLQAHIDGAGNVIGHLTCNAKPSRKSIALGSHFDTVRGGGKWDGVYGILSSIAVAKVINQRPQGVCALPFDILVAAFDDEEGNNPFGTTNFGAKAFAGVLDIAKDVPDFAELSRRYANIFPEVKGQPGNLEDNVAARVATAAADPDSLIAFLEVHIEQGPVLEHKNLPFGVVDAIAGQTRLSVTIRGKPGHAGTVPMDRRLDALAAAASIITLIETVGLNGVSKSLVATVGTLLIEPASTNVIPGLVRFSIDIRAPVDSDRLAAVKEILDSVDSLEASRGVKVSYEQTHNVAAVSMTPWVREVLGNLTVTPTPAWVAACIAETGSDNCSASFDSEDAEKTPMKAVTLTSGAGHDTQFMSRLTDVGMIFVRCRDGVSHHVDEHVEDEDSYDGARALLMGLEAIADRVRSMSDAE